MIIKGKFQTINFCKYKNMLDKELLKYFNFYHNQRIKLGFSNRSEFYLVITIKTQIVANTLYKVIIL